MELLARDARQKCQRVEWSTESPRRRGQVNFDSVHENSDGAHEDV